MRAFSSRENWRLPSTVTRLPPAFFFLDLSASGPLRSRGRKYRGDQAVSSTSAQVAHLGAPSQSNNAFLRRDECLAVPRAAQMTTAHEKRRLRTDAKAVKRFFVSDLVVAGSVIHRRVVGWDESEPPESLRPGSTDHAYHEIRELPNLRPELVGAGPPVSVEAAMEMRRVELPATLEAGVDLAGTSFGVRLPCVVYEFWCHPREHAEAAAAWAGIKPREVRALKARGWAPADDGYLGSGLLVLPQKQPFLLGTSAIVRPRSHRRKLSLATVLTDGPVVLGSACEPVEPVSSQRDSRGRYAKIISVDSNFAALNSASPDLSSSATRIPAAGPGYSSDRIVHELRDGSRTLSRAHVMAVRHFQVSVRLKGVSEDPDEDPPERIGTREPWKHRAPSLGFSPPASVLHVPPGDQAAVSMARNWMRGVGRDKRLCDPYVDYSSIQKFLPRHRGLRVLTSSERWKALDLPPKQSFRSGEIVVRIEPAGSPIHDRFLVGHDDAILLGTSLNGIGKTHAFLTKCDAENRRVVERVFEDLWSRSRAPSP